MCPATAPRRLAPAEGRRGADSLLRFWSSSLSLLLTMGEGPSFSFFSLSPCVWEGNPFCSTLCLRRLPSTLAWKLSPLLLKVLATQLSYYPAPTTPPTTPHTPNSC